MADPDLIPRGGEAAVAAAAAEEAEATALAEAADTADTTPMDLTRSFTATTDVDSELASEPDPTPAQAAQLADLVARATAKYAVRDYEAAAELYSRATELQAAVNGEMSTRNADLLYFYGRCLYHVAVGNSDVLGTKVAGEKKKEKKVSAVSGKREVMEASGKRITRSGSGRKNEDISKVEAKAGAGAGAGAGKLEGVKEEGRFTTVNANETELGKATGTDAAPSPKPYFQFTGDENWDDSDENGEEEAEGKGDDAAEADEDDFQNAFEMLDLARVLLQRRLEEALKAQREVLLDERSEEGKTQTVNAIKERLADTHDLQAEIALEAERFAAAVVDLRAGLALKSELFAPESSLLAEAHYKLSLALEFASMSQGQQEQQHQGDGADAAEVQAGKVMLTQVDMKMRAEAASHMERAISSCRRRVEIEEAALAEGRTKATTTGGTVNGRRPRVTRQSVDEVGEMVADMELRLAELRAPPVSVVQEAARPDPAVISGILGGLVGKSEEAKRRELEEVARGANDLSGLVKKKEKQAPKKEREMERKQEKKKKAAAATRSNVRKPASPASSRADARSGEKRKLEDEADTADGKKARQE